MNLILALAILYYPREIFSHVDKIGWKLKTALISTDWRMDKLKYIHTRTYCIQRHIILKLK